jgi:Ca2+:H+ antiporter
MLKKLFAPENLLNLLLIFVPIAIVLEFMHANPIMIFAASGLAIIPLAGWMGRATEHLAEKMGEGLGGLLNATFGNAAELIIALMALRKGLFDVVKASITGSIIGNILLVLGLSVLLGGLKYPKQVFNKTAAMIGSTMLGLSAIALIMPAVFHIIVQGKPNVREQDLSLEIAIVLIITYVLSLIFTLRTHSHLYSGGVACRHVAGRPDERVSGRRCRRDLAQIGADRGLRRRDRGRDHRQCGGAFHSRTCGDEE